MVDALATRVEQDVIRDAAFVTTSSEAIGNEYRRRYGVDASVIHNTFPLPAKRPDFTRARPDGLPGLLVQPDDRTGTRHRRGRDGAGPEGVAAELTLLGRARKGISTRFMRSPHAGVTPVTVHHQIPVAPDAMIDFARGYDVGLALDCGAPLNRQLCMTNKAFTYILAGVPVAMADTPGQHALGVDLGAGAALVAPGDVDALTAALAHWAHNPAALDAAKRTAWARAADRWHWEHDAERGRLLQLVEQVLS